MRAFQRGQSTSPKMVRIGDLCHFLMWKDSFNQGINTKAYYSCHKKVSFHIACL